MIKLEQNENVKGEVVKIAINHSIILKKICLEIIIECFFLNHEYGETVLKRML